IVAPTAAEPSGQTSGEDPLAGGGNRGKAPGGMGESPPDPLVRASNHLTAGPKQKPTDQKVGGSNPSERAESRRVLIAKVLVTGLGLSPSRTWRVSGLLGERE